MQSNKSKKITLVLLVLLVILSVLKISYASEAEEIRIPKESVRLVDNNFKLIESLRPVSAKSYNFTNNQLNHTKEEIIQKYNASRRVTTKNNYSQIFTENAVFTDDAQHEATLSEQAIIDTLNELNYMRFLAGGYSEETVSYDGNPYCGMGAVLLSQSNFSHHPDKPTTHSMSDEFYSNALYGTGNGHTFDEYNSIINDVSFNVVGASIAAGTYCDIVSSIKVWLDDSGQIGHRLSLLDPFADYCSMGACHNTSPYLSGIYDYDSLLQLMNYSYSKYSNNYYTWPAAGYCPIESIYAKDRLQPDELPVYWSITVINPTTTIDYDNLSIKVTYNGTDYDISNIYTSLDGYNIENTIYFEMNSSVLNSISQTKTVSGSSYSERKFIPGKSVTVTVYDAEGNTVLSYPVNFFSETEVSVPEVTSVSLDKHSLNLNVGDISNVTATVETSGDVSYNLQYTSSNTSVATVDNSGKVTAVAPGSATITASAGGKSDTCLVTVYEETEFEFELKYSEKTIEVGEYFVLTPSSVTYDGTSYKVNYSSSDTSVATCSGNVIRGVGAGTATITAEANGYTATCLVTVTGSTVEDPKVTGISLDKSNETLNIGDTLKLTPTISTVGNPSYTISWSSSVPSVATVDNSGKVTAISSGTTIITASVSGYSATCTIVVNEENKIISVTLNYSNISLKVGKYTRLIATVNKTGNPSYTLNWRSLDTSIAYVDQDGSVYARKEGTTKVIVTAGDKSAECIVNVSEDAQVTGISLNKSSSNLNVGDTLKIIATVSTTGNPTYSINWKSSNSSVATVSSSGLVTAINEGTATITASASGYSAKCIITVIKPVVEDYANILYRSYVENNDWENSWRINGESSGTSGKSLKLEGLQVKLDTNIPGSVEYSSHVEIYGWETTWRKDGATSGRPWQNLRLEAIKIRLTGEIANKYDIYYRLHVQNIGWLDWACNGKEAGSSGYGFRVEAIEIKLVEKGKPAPGYVLDSYREKGKEIKVSYSTHVQNIGDQAFVSNGAIAGTSGQSLRLESIRINLENIEGSIEYRTHIQNIGWETSWRKDGERSGTSGRSLRLEAIQIRLTGKIAEEYDVYYRVHAQNVGWMGWAKNGESAGTSGHSFRLEGIEIVLVKKGNNPPAYNPPAAKTFAFYN